jgi:hypothetical protein
MPEKNYIKQFETNIKSSKRFFDDAVRCGESNDATGFKNNYDAAVDAFGDASKWREMFVTDALRDRDGLSGLSIENYTTIRTRMVKNLESVHNNLVSLWKPIHSKTNIQEASVA